MRVYFDFYRSLENFSLFELSQGQCQSFEPLFCYTSAFMVNAFNSEVMVHYFWIFSYYTIVFLSILKLSAFQEAETKTKISSGVILVVFIFVILNFHHPHEASHLIRQYVAASLVLYAFVVILNGESGYISMISALLIHFGSLPFLLMLLLLRYKNRAVNIKNKTILISLIILIIVPTMFYIIYFYGGAYLAVIQQKFIAYQYKNDGDITLLAELKIIIMFIIFSYMFRKNKAVLLFSTLLILFYIMTFPYDLFHLRYYKYFTVLLVPVVFVLFSENLKNAGIYLLVMATLYRIYGYLYASV